MKLTFVIPVYNNAATLKDSVASLKSQDFSDWEAVIIDDGSSDSSSRLADALAAEDRRIRVFHQANGGVSVARNRGMDEARGDWVAWLDADDAYIPGALRRMSELIDANPGCQCLQFPYLEMQPDGSTEPRVPPAYSSYGGRSFTGSEAFDVLFARDGAESMNWQPWPATCSDTTWRRRGSTSLTVRNCSPPSRRTRTGSAPSPGRRTRPG